MQTQRRPEIRFALRFSGEIGKGEQKWFKSEG